MLKRLFRLFIVPSEFETFLSRSAMAINHARLEHLGSLGLNLNNKSVLEVGAGIGFLTGFFEKLNCDILSTDSRQKNISELKRRFPHRRATTLDLERKFNQKKLGNFEIVFCYGTLYHLSDPNQALKKLAKICKEIILIETVVSPEEKYSIDIVPEKISLSQSSSLVGCRPTRKAVFSLLKKHFGYAYTTVTQPNHPDFIVNWKKAQEQSFYRAIFIGSKRPLIHKTLLTYLPDKQKKYEG